MEVIGWSVLLSAIVSALLGVGAGIVTSIVRIRLYEKEREKTERQLFVHRLQFEKEFELYKELWSLIVELKGAIILLIPSKSLENSHSASNRYDPMVKIEHVRQKFEKYQKLTFLNYPFFYPAIYESAMALQAILLERLTYGGEVAFEHREWPENENNYRKMDEEIDSIGGLIQERIMLHTKGARRSYIPRSC